MDGGWLPVRRCRNTLASGAGGAALAALSVAAAIVVARTYAARGGRATDLDAATIDEDAGLAGELRSATWFAALPERDTWAECHVARAATRLRGISLPQLYPPVPARRAQLTTAALVPGHIGAVDDVAVRGTS